MSVISQYARVGISPSMLFPASFEDDLLHLHSINTVCRMPQYEVLETFLAEDAGIRKQELRIIRETGKILNYNSPMALQQDGPQNPCGDDPEIRKAGLAYAKMNVDFAGEAGTTVFVLPSPPDKGPDRREELKKRFADYYYNLAEHARQYKMDICLEPIERHRFKGLLMGPTDECVELILNLQKQGAENAKIICDICHIPLMEEDIRTALDLSMKAGLRLIHMADAVLLPDSEFYGHTHPPIGVQGGMFDQKELAQQFSYLFDCGYLPGKPGQSRPFVSLEVRPYPGVSPETSALAMFEKLESACRAALKARA
ncbi:sugar phosphate isomerase/epimerase [Bacteroides sp. OttesenSCG-928-J23]|nr:sugar phosphate isomerase/epimerase [Bacteroides sp. OttesenSCG-928-J23]